MNNAHRDGPGYANVMLTVADLAGVVHSAGGKVFDGLSLSRLDTETFPPLWKS